MKKLTIRVTYDVLILADDNRSVPEILDNLSVESDDIPEYSEVEDSKIVDYHVLDVR